MLKIQLCITGINCILKYINVENKLYLNCNNIYNIQYNYCFYCIFNQINAALVRMRYITEIPTIYSNVMHLYFCEWLLFVFDI